VTWVRYAEADPQGLAALVGGLIQANLERDPPRAALLRPGVVVIEAHDATTVVTLSFGEGDVEIRSGSSSGTDVRVRATGEELLALVNTPLRLGFPDPLRAEGRAMLLAIATRRVHVRGLARSPALVRRLTMLLSVR
jgi:hypothetical protein